MTLPRRVEDVYPAVEKLIDDLKSSGHVRLATILDHRMHKVAWTSGSELFEELQRLLSQALESEAQDLPEVTKDQMRQIIKLINSYFTQA